MQIMNIMFLLISSPSAQWRDPDYNYVQTIIHDKTGNPKSSFIN